MKDYKRLTEKRETPLVMSMWADSCYSLRIHNRLADLEDKIERGEIDYVADKDKEIARLTAENDKLRARLENAIELPCKVGDTVYWIDDNEIYEYSVQGFAMEKSKEDLRVILDDMWLCPVVDVYKDSALFFDRTKAEAKLKEVGGDAE